MKNKKVWYISKYALSPDQGGPSRQFLLSKYFGSKGYKTCLISSNSNGFSFLKFKGAYKLTEYSNFKHYILNGTKINLGFNIRRIYSWIEFEYRLIRFLRNKNITNNDVVIVSSLSLLTFLSGIYLKRKHGIKLIAEVRDIWPQTLIDFKNFSKYNPVILLLSAIEKSAYKKADFIVGTMGNLGEHIKITAAGNEQKFRYIPMGFDESVLEEDYDNSPLHTDEFIVGYAGTIGLANKIDLILESAILLRNNKKIKFKLLGDGVLKEHYMVKYGSLPNVEFLPRVKKNKVGRFLSKCSILVNPWEDNALYKYGISPNKWIDYMYAAKPIIVPFNGFKNIINEARCGEFIETNNVNLLANTIVKYAKMSSEELDKIGKNGKRYLEENLNYDVLTNRYKELF